MMSNQEEGDRDDGIVNHDEILSPLLRRGRRITEDTHSSEESEESEEEGEGSDKPDPVAWSMPDGFTLGAEPSKLDASLVDSCDRCATAATDPRQRRQPCDRSLRHVPWYHTHRMGGVL